MLVVAAGKVGAPDRPLEQDVANQGQSRRLVIEDDVAGRVPRAMDHVEHKLADGHLIAILEPAVGLERVAFDAEIAAVVAESRDPESILLLRSFDRYAELLGEDSGAAAMVDMAVG